MIKLLTRPPVARVKRVSCSSRGLGTILSPTIKELLLNPPKNDSIVSTQGHIKSIRQFKNIGFIDLSDGSTYLSLSIVIGNPESAFKQNRYQVGQSISVKGLWRDSQGTQKHELVYDPDENGHSLSLIGGVTESYPIQKKSQTLQFLRTLPTLRHRTSTLAAILRFRSFMESKMNDFFESESFVKVSPPLITSSDCEGAGEQFKVEPLNKPVAKDKEEDLFFGKNTYLTVSTQLHLEVLAQSLNRVWTLTPCFRAENSNTNRHLSEFWMLEAEICYISDVRQLTAFTEAMLRYVTVSIRDKADSINSSGNFDDLINSRFNKLDIENITNRWSTLLSDKPWPTITYTEAIDIINKVKNKGRLKGRLNWGDSIQTDHEKWLAGEHFNSPVFITDYPASEKPFYMPPSTDFNPERPTVACFDLIVPAMGELIGGSMREHRYNELVAEMKRRNMDIEEMDWYLSTRLNGSVPHGGFGMGFERLISYLGAMENIKDVIPFPRAPQICHC